jgi:hypothetical protein
LNVKSPLLLLESLGVSAAVADRVTFERGWGKRDEDLALACEGDVFRLFDTALLAGYVKATDDAIPEKNIAAVTLETFIFVA